MRPANTVHSDPLETLVMPRSLRVVMLVMLATSLATAVFAQPHPKIAANTRTFPENSSIGRLSRVAGSPHAALRKSVYARPKQADFL
jgi:hypothetical protein